MTDRTSHGDLKRKPLSAGAAKPRVCLVGAGVSGLRCATLLLPFFDVTILESRSRCGGRVAQERVGDSGGRGGHLVDLGANWIHGTVGNPVLDVARETGTSWEEDKEDAGVATWDEKGERMGDEEVEKASGVFWELVGEAMAYSDEMRGRGDGVGEGDGIKKEASLWDWMGERVKERVEGEEARRVVMQMSEAWGNFVGADVRRQSLRNFWMEEFGEGGNLFLDGTYKKIIDAVAKPAVEGADVRFNSKVTKICSQKEETGKVKVEIEGSQQLEFDEVVVTCPLGWLKRNLDAFEPPLPWRFQQAVQNLGYGCLEKVLITFPEAFWKGGSDGRKTEGMMQWLMPTYASETNPSRFIQFAMDLASMTPSASHPTLLFYISGSQSQQLVPHLAALPSRASRAEYLASYFQPYFSRLNNYDSRDSRCQPVDAIATDWLLDEDAGYGSYSNFQVGLDDGGGDVEVLRKGEGATEKGVWFAGEHTHLKAIGTVTGAWWSGEGVARRLREVYGV